MSDLCDQLDDILGVKGVVRDPFELAPWVTDWRDRYHGRALALVAPADREQLQAVVRLAAANRVPLVPQGGNTSMVGGATPDESGTALIVSLRRMNCIRAIDAAAMTATVDAGVILADLHLAAADHGLRFPLSLGARGSATIGGLISTNAGGTQVLRFGTMRALVLGLEAVLPDGTLIDRLVPLKKDNRGYDILSLLIGGEGTLGIVTGATLKLVPAIVDRAVGWIGVASPHAALALLRTFERATGEAIESFEIIPADSLDLVLRHIPGTRAPLAGRHAWHVLVEAVGPAPGSAAAMLETLLSAALDRGDAGDAVIAANEGQAEAFWHLRDSISEAERAAGSAVQHDISVPVAAMPDFMIAAAAAMERRFAGVTASAFGHLGDGNVHFHVRAPDHADPAWRDRDGPAISRAVHDLVVAAGGSISAEHGIGQMKRDELARLEPPARIAAMRAIKAALDPLGIMNPGKLIG